MTLHSDRYAAHRNLLRTPSSVAAAKAKLAADIEAFLSNPDNSITEVPHYVSKERPPVQPSSKSCDQHKGGNGISNNKCKVKE